SCRISLRDSAFSVRTSSTNVRSWRTCSCKSSSAVAVLVTSFCGEAGRVEANSWAGAWVPMRMRAVTAAAVRRKAKVLGLFTPSSCPTRDKYEVKDREADLHIRTPKPVVHHVPPSRVRDGTPRKRSLHC